MNSIDFGRLQQAHIDYWKSLGWKAPYAGTLTFNCFEGWRGYTPPGRTDYYSKTIGRFRKQLTRRSRTRWEPDFDADEWRFISPWGPADELQDEITRQLAAIDPAIVVTNFYYEEYDQAIGVRICRLVNGDVQAEVEDCSMSDKRARLVSLLQQGCASAAEWRLKYDGCSRDLIDVCTEEHFEC